MEEFGGPVRDPGCVCLTVMGRVVMDAIKRCTVRMEGPIAIRKEILFPNIRCGSPSPDQGKDLIDGGFCWMMGDSSWDHEMAGSY